MAEIVWTESALRELEDIADYIAVVNKKAAGRMISSVMQRVSHLKDFPESGRFPPETDSRLYRELVITPIRLFYRYSDNRVFIVHIMRAERELRQYLLS
ncbi:MAG: type II toxin-antitoxin system RelE/ParE family toxin [Spirochaetales bacterium]|nr:type II toxin-antitoxin system RelE/ParE family toxin [Spirochaetales bacterium]